MACAWCRYSVSLVLLATMTTASLAQTTVEQNAAESLQTLFVAHCTTCHGGLQQEGGLRLDRLATHWGQLFEQGYVDQDTPEQGMIWQLVHESHDANKRMPPETRLTQEELARLESLLRDIDRNQPPKSDELDAASNSDPWLLEPFGHRQDEVVDTTDHGDENASSPNMGSPTSVSVEATTETEINSRMRTFRRISLDLIGLPPSSDELRRFANDARPDAIYRAVDRLTASPNFGERWTRVWMDQARYGDSEGFDIDQPRMNSWRYRTWLIDCFNRDEPFDRFSRDQLAADLEPASTTDNLVGLGFLAQSTRNTEAGADPEEDLIRRSCDRLETTADIWLGLQLDCASCHNHPFQDITQEDYYRLLALFRNLYDASLNAAPEFTAEAYAREAPVTMARIEELKTTLDSYRRNIAKKSFHQWLSNTSFEKPAKWLPLVVDTAEAYTGEDLEVLVDQSVFASGPLPDYAEYHITGRSATKHLTGLKIETLPHPFLPEGGPGRHPDGSYTISHLMVRIHRAGAPNEPELVDLAMAWTSTGNSAHQLRLILDPNATKRDRFREIWRVESPGGKGAVLVAEFKSPINLEPGDRLEVEIGQSSDDWMLTIGRLKISTTSSVAPIIDPACVGQPWNRVSKAEYSECKELFEYFLLRDSNDLQLLNAIKTLESLLPESPAEIQADIVRESDRNLPTTVYERGDYERPTVEVKPGLPNWLQTELGGSVANRLDLAHWLFDEAQGVTSRVVAARVWQRLSDEIILRPDAGDSWSSPSDVQRARVDNLAQRFVGSQWSFKSLVRCAILEREFEMSELDSSRQLEAEMIRDSLLMQSRLLNSRVGGRSVVMPQPLGRVEGAFSRALPLDPGRGQELYVRGLYVWWQRTSPFPLFVQFGTPKSNQCETIRLQESTASQALSLLNDAYVYDYIRHLALDVYIESDRARHTIDERLDETFLRILGRLPLETERQRSLELVNEFTQFYQANPELVEKILTGVLASPESSQDQSSLAAWIMLTRVVVNTPDFVGL